MDRRITNNRFGNCVHCKAYTLLSLEGFCTRCAAEIQNAYEKAVRMTQKNPMITREEISDQLGLPLERIDAWIRTGKLRCVTVRFICPKCEKEVVNQMTCKRCGYTPKQEQSETKKNAISSSQLQEHLHERFSRDRKRSSYRWRLLASLPGIRNLSTNES